MKQYQSLDIGFFVAGAVLAAGGLAVFLVGQLHHAAVEVTPSVAPGRVGAMVEAHFQ